VKLVRGRFRRSFVSVCLSGLRAEFVGAAMGR
jgi:hypothetical protein